MLSQFFAYHHLFCATTLSPAFFPAATGSRSVNLAIVLPASLGGGLIFLLCVYCCVKRYRRARMAVTLPQHQPNGHHHEVPAHADPDVARVRNVHAFRIEGLFLNMRIQLESVNKVTLK